MITAAEYVYVDTTNSQMSPQPRLRLSYGDIWESVVSHPR